MGGSVEKAVTEGRRMILEEKIKFVTVGIHSGAAVAVGNLGKEHKVLINGGFATTKRLTGESGHDYVARANLSTVEIGRVMAEYLKSRSDIKRVSVISPDYEYGQHFAADFIAGLKVVRPDITIVRQEWPKLGATDFGAARHRAAVAAGRPGGRRHVRRRPGQLPALGEAISACSAERRSFMAHGLDLAKMGALKDSLPPNTMGTVWYPFYAIDTPKSKAFAAEVEKRMKTYPDRILAGRLCRRQDAGRGDPQGGHRRRRRRAQGARHGAVRGARPAPPRCAPATTWRCTTSTSAR